MSANKYANLPDIDTAPDVYETEDIFQPSETNKGDSSDEETSLPTRSGGRVRNGDGREDVDYSNLLGADKATRKFERAEKRRDRLRTHYAYPESPTTPTTPAGTKQPLTLSARLRLLQTELSALETELADPSNPLLAKEREEDNVDPGELIRGLVDVKARLGKISKGKEGRGKLVEALLGEEDVLPQSREQFLIKEKKSLTKDGKESAAAPDIRSIAELDKRVGELETLVGSSTTALDETSPLPPPLLPLVTRLNNQLQILTQPRHVDSISRRLKLLISDLDRASTAQHNSHRRPPSTAQQPQQPPQQSPGGPSSALQEQLLPLLTRLGPSLPHIPHILTRLRTLSTLHTAAAEFQNTLEGLEEEQRQMRDALRELKGAVDKVEVSMEENRQLVKRNVEGLEGRVEVLLDRVEKVGK